jgi:hypothetical protein
MSTLLLTLAIAFVIVVIAVGLLGIGWLITGKSRMQPGACGRDPHKRSKDEECGTSPQCQLCDHKPEDTQPEEKK